MNIDRLRELFDLNFTTGELRWRVGRGRARAGDIAGGLSGPGYLYVGVDGIPTLAHRIVFALVHGFVSEYVDHKNGNRTDNRPSNLRAATNSQNSTNQRLRGTNRSGVKGVYWYAQRSKWLGQVTFNGRTHTVGYFNDLREAEAKVMAFREQLCKEFARHK